MKKIACPLCKMEVPDQFYDLHRFADNLVIERMKRDFPEWSENDGVCQPCLERYKNLQRNAA